MVLSFFTSYLIALTIPPIIVATPLAASFIQSPLILHALADKDVREELKKAEIIPDVLDDFHPQVYVDVSYPSSHNFVNLGNEISPSNVSTSPVFEIHTNRNAPSPIPTPTLPSNVTYTLVLTDPDATSRSDPIKAEMCHWIVTDISSQTRTSYSIDTVELNLGTLAERASNPTELISYLPPSPPPGTGFHRYIFVLLASEVENKPTGRQPNITTPVDRPHWGYGKVGEGVRRWAKENQLIVVGANFFYAKDE